MKSVYTGDEKVAEFESYDELRVGDGKPAFIYEGSELVYPNPVKDGLVLWYDFSGRTNADGQRGIAEDLSGNGNHGTLQNFNYTAESGYDKNKLLFDGVDDYVQATQNTYENFTVEMVLKLKPFQKVGSIFGSRRSVFIDTKESGIEIRSDSNSLLRYYIVDGTTISTNGVGAGIDMSEKIFHLLFLKGVDGGFIAINGQEVSRFSAQDVGTITDSRPLSLGTRGSSATYGQNVEFSSFKFYNKALTPEEISHNYAIEKERFGIE